jgi:GNAT superfamily N-acetyltransferase
MTPSIHQPSTRPLDPDSAAEVDLVAHRMRETLIEVVGTERGQSLATLDWLRARVRWHLDPAACTGAVLLAEDRDGRVVGHTIVRVDAENEDQPVGLFSTTWVAPEVRRRGVADRLLDAGEAWMRGAGMTRGCTWTAHDNHRLIALYNKRGYAIVETTDEMVRLARALTEPKARDRGPRPL